MKEYSLSDLRDRSATAVIAYTIRAMNNCGFSKMQVDRYIKMSKDLSYNELVDLSNSILSTCNNYIKDLYNDTNEGYNMKRTLEQRVTRLEKRLNEKLLERRIAKLESALSDERYVGDLDDSTANYIYNKVKNRLSRKYALVKLIDGCTDTYTEWVIAMNGPGEYVSYSLTPGKDEDYEPIDGIDVEIRGDDGSEEWSGSKRHFNNADEVISYILGE